MRQDLAVSIKLILKGGGGLEPIKVSSYDDPGLTLTYFMARSNFATYIGFYMGQCE